MANKRISFDVSEHLVEMLDALAAREGVERVEIIRRAFSIMKVFDEQMKKGNIHLGFTSSADTLNVELVGILTPHKYGY